MIIGVFKDFINFVRNPDDEQLKCSFRDKLSILIVLLAAHLLFLYIIAKPILDLVESYVKFPPSPTTNFSMTETFWLFVIGIPFIEELVFRYYLRYQGLKTIILSRAKWNKYFPILVYVTCFLFSFLHLTNFPKRDLSIYLLSPIIVLPQVVGGLIITYLRVRHNFISGLFFHWLWNLFSIILIPVMLYACTDGFSESTSKYSISYEYVLFLNLKEKRFEFEEFDGRITRINARSFPISQIIDTIFYRRYRTSNDHLINLKFESREGLTRDELVLVLNSEFGVERQDSIKVLERKP